MKRLFMQPGLRGSGAGRLLAEAIIREAAAAGYGEMLLDSLPSMNAVRGLYRSLGI